MVLNKEMGMQEWELSGELVGRGLSSVYTLVERLTMKKDQQGGPAVTKHSKKQESWVWWQRPASHPSSTGG